MDLVFAPRQIELWPIEKLRPYAKNAKIHGEAQVAKIAASMAKFGWTVPCLVADDGELIAGHGRVLAAGALGLTEAPVIRLGHLDEAERRAYRIADNKLTELGEWDEAMLRDEIAGLLAEDFDLDLLGFSDEDLDALLQDPETVGDDGAVEGEDDIPEPPVNPVSVAGDLWQLGSHRLICGDSTSADVVGRLLGSVKPLLMVTDPPYGVEYDPSWRNQAGAAKTTRGFARFRESLSAPSPTARLPRASHPRAKEAAMSATTDATEANTEIRDAEDTVLESATEQDEQEAEQSVQEEDPAPVAAAAPLPAPAAAQPSNLADLSAQLREAAAEIAEIAAQAGRLGIAIDAAKALRDGTAPEALRKLVLQRAAAAADARDIVAAPW